MPQRLATLALRAAQLALVLLAAAYLIYFADHARQLLTFAFPLDYGEGPLLAQVERLSAGTPVWRLYGDPAAPPFQIVNYPPLYLLLSAALAPLTGSALLAGRLIGLLSTLASVYALALLASPVCRASALSPQPSALSPQPSALLLALLFLTVPIVREWSALMRVDMLGLCLGLWGLVVLTRAPQPSPPRAAAAGLLLTASLFVKPSLLAAPAAAVLWLLWSILRRRSSFILHPSSFISLIVSITLVGGGLFALLQWASDGWFALHVVAANANRWEIELARDFWLQQLELRWTLAAAAAVTVVAQVWPRPPSSFILHPSSFPLALLYTLLGALTAAGVGKVGAYSNYFLELYAGLIWLVVLGAAAVGRRPQAPAAQPSTLGASARSPQPAALPFYVLRSTFYVLLLVSLLYYPPLWDETRLRPAGLIEPSTPRFALGRYGLWADMAREADLLAAQSRVGAALNDVVLAAGPRILSDMPGVPAAAAVESRLQAFEARQLLDQGLADERVLLHELANGELPLAVIDYLGNWLSPGVIEILQRRYAHDGALGTFDLYRPVAVGPAQPVPPGLVAAAGVELTALSLAAPIGFSYEPGETIALILAWQRSDSPVPAEDLHVVLRLSTPEGYPLIEHERPLLYGVYPPTNWPANTPVQHMQPLALPFELPDGPYQIAVGMRAATGSVIAPPQPIASLHVAWQTGTIFEPTGHFVPGQLLQAWADLGGIARAGLPLTPVVPFAWGRLQCFERVCLELRDEQVIARPLGSQLYLAETIRGATCLEGQPSDVQLCASFAGAPEQFAELGPPISGELLRNGWLVQWSEGARLERAPNGGEPALGRLGDESLRLPPGAPYRWP